MQHTIKKQVPAFLVLSMVFSLALWLGFMNQLHAATPKAQAPTEALGNKQAAGYYNISNEQLQQLLEQGVVLVDIRRQEEWQQTGIVEGSKTLTFFDKQGRINPDFAPQFTALVTAEQPVMLICRTGNRTRAVSQALVKQLGYKNVMNVTNGIHGWLAEKRKVVKYENAHK